jgi:hypothetical protein
VYGAVRLQLATKVAATIAKSTRVDFWLKTLKSAKADFAEVAAVSTAGIAQLRIP